MIDDYIEEGCVAYRVANSKEAKLQTRRLSFKNHVFSHRKPRVFTS